MSDLLHAKSHGHAPDSRRKRRTGKFWALTTVILLVIGVTAYFVRVKGPAGPITPKTWDDEALKTLEVPLVNPGFSPTFAPSSYYYRIPVRPIYQSYPVYRPDREPPGYMQWLERQQPEISFDPSKIKGKQDWIRAGALVFYAPIEFDPRMFMTVADVRDIHWYEQLHVPVTKQGVMPFARYVIRKKGRVELGTGSCSTCHLRIMPDGSVIVGAQGNIPYDRVAAYALRASAAEAEDKRAFLTQVEHERRMALGVPWLKPDPLAGLEQMSLDTLVSQHEAIPPGVAVRVNTSFYYPPQIPSLIGVQSRRYLDHTGLICQRSIADLMRYAALVQGGVHFERFGNFSVRPTLPYAFTQLRYSDAQLYALAVFVYSLKPPPNPNKFDAQAHRGQKIFQREGCPTCHTPPLYTNNKLTLAEGFHPSVSELSTFDILPVSVGTDPGLALRTREGTGFYRVPSLRGVWYRGPFEHDGSVATLEDWFDPRRTREDYVPTGFRGAEIKTRAVRGHPFGLDLSPQDRAALIAFLKTL